MRSAVSASTRSPSSWPIVSFTCLKASRSSSSIETGWPSRRERASSRSTASVQPRRFSRPVRSSSVACSRRRAVRNWVSRTISRSEPATVTPTNTMMAAWPQLTG